MLMRAVMQRTSVRYRLRRPVRWLRTDLLPSAAMTRSPVAVVPSSNVNSICSASTSRIILYDLRVLEKWIIWRRSGSEMRVSRNRPRWMGMDSGYVGSKPRSKIVRKWRSQICGAALLPTPSLDLTEIHLSSGRHVRRPVRPSSPIRIS